MTRLVVRFSFHLLVASTYVFSGICKWLETLKDVDAYALLTSSFYLIMRLNNNLNGYSLITGWWQIYLPQLEQLLVSLFLFYFFAKRWVYLINYIDSLISTYIFLDKSHICKYAINQLFAMKWTLACIICNMFYMSVSTIPSVNRIYVWWLFVKAMSWCTTRIHVPHQEFTESHWYCSDNSEDKRFMHPSGAKGSTLVSSLRTTILVSPWLLFTSTVRERMAAEEEGPRRYICLHLK